MNNKSITKIFYRPQNPKLSVCIVTYNQKNYIKKCIESVLNQQTNFEFEILIADDCSNDGTKEIVEDFASKYPDRIFIDFRENNVGAFLNYKLVHAFACGKYVMHLDGDDYCFPRKLQMQVDFLESNTDCNLVSHKMHIGDDIGHWAQTRSNPALFNINYLLCNHPCFLNSSMMYRRSVAEDLFLKNFSFIDFYVYVHFALRGPIGFIDEALGYYRSGIGISSKRNLMPYIQQAIDLAAVSLGENAEVKRCRSKSYLSYAIAALMLDDFKEFKANLSSARAVDPKWVFPHAFAAASLSPRLLKKAIRIFKSRRIKNAKIN